MFRIHKSLCGILAASLFAFASSARGQAVVPVFGAVAGVSISPDGLLQARQIDASLTPKRDNSGHLPGMAYVSLPRAFEALRANVEQNTPIPEDLKYLGGITQIRYIYVYPEQKDIVIAGTAEPIDAASPLEPIGKLTGRPIIQLEDLITALRAVEGKRTADFFGCSLDTVASSQKVSDDVVKKYNDAPRPILIAEMKKAIGPQQVRLIGVPENSRLALAMVAADYRLKRLSMGAEPAPIDGLASAVNDAAGASRLWFEPSYEPLLVSAQGDAFELRGPRLQVACGAQMFDARGASDAAKRFAKTFSEKMPQLAGKVEAIADLQNISDLLLVATLIRHDRLDQKAGIDLTWALDSSKFTPTALPVPKTAETVVHITGKAIASGGVALSFDPAIAADHRAKDDSNTLTAANHRPENWLGSDTK